MAPLGDKSMEMPMKDSHSQGTQYLNIHKGQYGGSMGSYPGAVVQGSLVKAQAGGAAAYPASVMSSSLPISMVPAARTGPLDAAFAGIKGMQDGGRRSKNRKNRSNKRRSVKRRSVKRRSIKHRGGSHRALSSSPVDANPMLLPAGMEKQASLNYEWSMAKDPSAFLPKA